ncbi:hypothetical protein HPB51_008338 [Rhipicephalus microplus]|uniref:Uncharacterized protein n=1 Tax=Rhipicephalus microplus TaxID=6941 RepID=A0A9J6ES36_RHIMP|nr:hypothetical protein HPB51_008338 [Rhipicephalus microplus]
MRPQALPPGAVLKNNPPAVALRPLNAEPMPLPSPKDDMMYRRIRPLVPSTNLTPFLYQDARPFLDAPPSGQRDATVAEQGGGMMGNFGGGISPGSLEGISRLRMCMYIMGAMSVLFLLFVVYVYAMFDDSGGDPRAVPGVDNPVGLNGNDTGDAYPQTKIRGMHICPTGDAQSTQDSDTRP